MLLTPLCFHLTLKKLEVGRILSRSITDIQFDIVEVGGAGDIAYVYGKYSLTMAPEGKEPVKDIGKYIEIWNRQPDGSWKVALDIFNSDLPLAVSETEM